MMHREELLHAIIDAVRRQDSRALAARAAESHPSDVAEALGVTIPEADLARGIDVTQQ